MRRLDAHISPSPSFHARLPSVYCFPRQPLSKYEIRNLRLLLHRFNIFSFPSFIFSPFDNFLGMYCKRVLRESFVRLYRREDDNCFLILKKKKKKNGHDVNFNEAHVNRTVSINVAR